MSLPHPNHVGPFLPEKYHMVFTLMLSVVIHSMTVSLFPATNITMLRGDMVVRGISWQTRVGPQLN